MLGQTIPGYVQIHNISVSSDDTIVPNTGENNMEVANDLSHNIDDESEEELLEMSQFLANPLSNNESNIFTSNNVEFCQAQEYSSGKFMFSGKLS